MADGESRIGHTVPWLVTLVGFLIVLVRLLAVSHLDPPTVAALLDGSGIVTIVLSTIAEHRAPVLVVILLVVISVLSFGVPVSSERVLFRAALVMTCFLLVLFGPAWWIVMPVVMLDTEFKGPVSAAFVRRSVRRRLRSMAAVSSIMEQQASLETQPMVVGQDVIRSEQESLKRDIEELDSLEDDPSLTGKMESINERLERQRERVSQQEEELAARSAETSAARIEVAAEQAKLDAQSNLAGRLDRLLVGILAVLSCLAFVTLLDDTPWLPAEEFVLSGREEPLIGYALSVDPTGVIVLQQDPRLLVHLVADEVEARTVCDASAEKSWIVPSWLTAGLVDIFLDSPTYPICGDPAIAPAP